MKAWRLCRQPFAATALDGLGGLYASGRWHRQGHPVVYTASAASLAALEVLVHVDPAIAPRDLCLLTLDIPDDVVTERLAIADLPPDWQDIPAPAVLQNLGTDWLTSRRSCVLRVPSAVLPIEDNLLLNPSHPQIARIKVVAQQAFVFDRRLLG